MNFIVLKSNKLTDYLGSLQSENIGFYCSFFLHIIFLIFVIGLPNFFDNKIINIPSIIPIEIINISNVTSITKEVKNSKKIEIKKKEANFKEKKFNSSNNQEIKKIEIKEKPETKNFKIKENLMINKSVTKKNIPLKEVVLIEQKKEITMKLEKKQVKIDLNDFESLPTKKIKPKLKPKNTQVIENKKIQSNSFVTIKPKPNTVVKNKTEILDDIKPKKKPKLEFTIASMLKDLRNKKSTKKIENKNEIKEEEDLDQPTETNSKENVKLSISEIDLLLQQLSSCWNAPAGAIIEKGMIVKISAKIKQNRTIYKESVRIIDTNISNSNSFYGPITESAMRTLLNPECIPLKLPKDKYQLWKNLTIIFDYSIMKGY